MPSSPAKEGLSPSTARRPDPEDMDEREVLLEQFQTLKDEGRIKRMPKSNVPVERLRAKLAELYGEGDGGVGDESAPPSPKVKAKRSSPKKKAVAVNIEDEPMVKSDPGLFHSIYYESLESVAELADYAGVPELQHLGTTAKANQKTLNPLLDKVSAELGIRGGVELPPAVQLALCTGLMAGACYVNARPDIPKTAKGGIMVTGRFMSLNLAASAAAIKKKDE